MKCLWKVLVDLSSKRGLWNINAYIFISSIGELLLERYYGSFIGKHAWNKRERNVMLYMCWISQLRYVKNHIYNSQGEIWGKFGKRDRMFPEMYEIFKIIYPYI